MASIFTSRCSSAAGVLLVLNVAAGVVGIIFVVSAILSEPEHENYLMCLPCRSCEKAGIGSLREGEVCVRNTNELQGVLKQMYLSELDEHKRSVPKTPKKEIDRKRLPSVSFLSAIKPVIHLQGLNSALQQDEKSFLNDTSVRVIRSWNENKESPVILITNSMRYENGAITIPTRGVYRVYVHFTFTHRDTGHPGVSGQTYEQHVVRYNARDSTEEDLVSSNKSQCETIHKEPYAEYLTYSSTVVSLNPGDTVYVKANHLKSLMKDSDKHCFGVHLIW
ncbi:uncharacterized protein LOC121375116 isoform X1 [Gigantopelta aegis]|uniref:uncharacterized protein LOC121375116 isoform X1 n=1 Tax=Gigantopelta aegis TaxID=1735272 RepID=UPI001B88A0D7|nr:uncharacterized protein LOC121375116 isoform X1 [Gigantopelta aegis]